MEKSTIFTRRIKKISRLLAAEPTSSALLLESADQKIRSRDTFYPPRQDSNFYYLTGSAITAAQLCVTAKEAFLIVPPEDPIKTVWDGPPLDSKKLARELQVELVVTKQPLVFLQQKFTAIDTLFYDSRENSISLTIAQKMLAKPAGFRGNQPNVLAHCDLLLERLRLYKDATEVRAITQSIETSYEILKLIAPLIKAGTSEQSIASFLVGEMHKRNSTPAFETIAAAGANAATLHYTSLASKLKKTDLFLLDYGAEKNHYAADITRVFPVSGSFSSMQADLYDIVLRAQKAAIKRIQPGAKILSIYKASAKELVSGLIDLGILKGNVQANMKSGSFKKYFPHGVGHSLGIDVHDIGSIRNSSKAVLEKGMVITIEPGLYFPKKIKSIPACGIRIEDDILVTKDGHKNLSKMIPKERSEVEDFLSEYS